VTDNERQFEGKEWKKIPMIPGFHEKFMPECCKIRGGKIGYFGAFPGHQYFREKRNNQYFQVFGGWQARCSRRRAP